LAANEAVKNTAAVDGCSNLEVIDKFVDSAPVGDAAVEGAIDCGSNIAAVDELDANEAVKTSAAVDGCSKLEAQDKFVGSAPVGDAAVEKGVDFGSNIPAVDELSINEGVENAAAVDGCSNLDIIDTFVGSAPVLKMLEDAGVEGVNGCG
jgi:hypothetical protein